MSHLVLLGDSIFDNAAYVAGGPDVVRQVRDRLPPGWTATLRAVDGSVTNGVERQLGRLPADAGYLVVSVGGNDALGYASILEAGVHSVAEAVDRLATVRERFGKDYIGTVLTSTMDFLLGWPRSWHVAAGSEPALLSRCGTRSRSDADAEIADRQGTEDPRVIANGVPCLGHAVGPANVVKDDKRVRR